MEKSISLSISGIVISKDFLHKVGKFIEKISPVLIITLLTLLSIFFYWYYLQNGLGLSYNDARSHLDIGRRVVEGLKPGLAQLGSVWLPLPHALMVPTIWIDFMWHSGLSGAIQSMVSFVATGYLIFLFLKNLGVGMFERLFGVIIFIANINILYLQSTAMTELLLLATMTAGVYFLIHWVNDENVFNLVKSAFFIMASTLIRYDGWFLFFTATMIIAFYAWQKIGIQKARGMVIFFCTLGGLGIVMWLIWNLLIFRDPFYFAFGPFSAHAQQAQLETAGELPTKGNLIMSFKAYFYAVVYNSYTYTAILGLIGGVVLLLDKRIKPYVRFASLALFAPFVFNVLALFLGHSVLFLPEVIGETWFNVRYGMMLLPSIAIFSAYLVSRLKHLRWPIVGVFALVTLFAFVNNDAVTIDDAVYGSSQKNVTEVSGWLNQNAKDEEGFILISAASHDAIIFSSGLPMKKFIHEGTGDYWDYAVENPHKWVRWIIVRTHDFNDMTFRDIGGLEGLENYDLVDHYPFADIYQVKNEYLADIITTPILGKIK
jgi:hypothetical protein